MTFLYVNEIDLLGRERERGLSTYDSEWETGLCSSPYLLITETQINRTLFKIELEGLSEIKIFLKLVDSVLRAFVTSQT